MPNTVTLDIALVNQIMQYLGTKPYQEVFQLVQLVQAQAASQVKNEE
jgi:hypothetical protein